MKFKCLHCGKETEMDKQFKLHWKGSLDTQIVTGRTPSEAMNNAGIGSGALPALDHWEEIEED